MEDQSVGITVAIGKRETKVIVNAPGGVIYSHTLQVAGDAMDEAIARYVEQKHQLRIGPRTAEVLKIELGSAVSPGSRFAVEVRGRDASDNTIKEVVIAEADARAALKEPVNTIVSSVTAALGRVPAELSASVIAGGIILKGGGSLLRDLDQRLASATGMVVKRA